jgi:hypothetical protein
MALITEQVLIEYSADTDAIQYRIVNGTMSVPLTIETHHNAVDSSLLIVNGTMSVPLNVDLTAETLFYGVVLTETQIDPIRYPIIKTISEVDQVTTDKLVRPFGAGLPREFWY